MSKMVMLRSAFCHDVDDGDAASRRFTFRCFICLHDCPWWHNVCDHFVNKRCSNNNTLLMEEIVTSAIRCPLCQIAKLPTRKLLLLHVDMAHPNFGFYQNVVDNTPQDEVSYFCKICKIYSMNRYQCLTHSHTQQPPSLNDVVNQSMQDEIVDCFFQSPDKPFISASLESKFAAIMAARFPKNDPSVLFKIRLAAGHFRTEVLSSAVQKFFKLVNSNIEFSAKTLMIHSNIDAGDDAFLLGLVFVREFRQSQSAFLNHVDAVVFDKASSDLHFEAIKSFIVAYLLHAGFMGFQRVFVATAQNPSWLLSIFELALNLGCIKSFRKVNESDFSSGLPVFLGDCTKRDRFWSQKLGKAILKMAPFSQPEEILMQLVHRQCYYVVSFSFEEVRDVIPEHDGAWLEEGANEAHFLQYAASFRRHLKEQTSWNFENITNAKATLKRIIEEIEK